MPDDVNSAPLTREELNEALSALSPGVMAQAQPSQADQEAAAAAAQPSTPAQQLSPADQEAAAAAAAQTPQSSAADQEAAGAAQAHREVAWAQAKNLLDNSTIQQLADNHQGFRAPEFFNQWKDVLTDDQTKKIALAHDLRINSGMTGADLAAAGKNAPGAVTGWVSSLWDVAKHLPDFLGTDTDQTKATRSAAQAAFEANSLRLVNTARQYLRNQLDQMQDTGTFDTSLLGFATPQVPHLQPPKNDDRALQNLYDDAAAAQQIQQASQGQGEFAKLTGRDVDTLKDQGVTINQDAYNQEVEKFAPALDPVNAAFFLKGLSAIKLADGTFGVAAQGGRVVAKSATREGAEKFIQWASQKAESGAASVKNLAKKVDSGTGLLTGWGAEVLGVPKVAGVAIAAAPKVVRGVAAAAEKTAQLAGNPNVYGPMLDVFGNAAKGGLEGLKFGAPLAAMEQEPADQANSLVSSAAMGAAGGAASVPIGWGWSKAQAAGFSAKQTILASYFDNSPNSAPVADTVLPGGNQDLEATHGQNLATLKTADPQAANTLNRLRAAMFAGNGQRSYLVTPEQAEAINPAFKDKEGVFQDQNGNMLWVLNKDAVQSLGHEPGHFLDKYVLNDDDRAALDKINAPYQEVFDQHYTSLPGLTDDQRAQLTPEKLRGEFRAEQLGSVLQNHDLTSSVPFDWAHNTLGLVVDVLERAGLHKGGLGGQGEAGLTPLDFRRTLGTDDAARGIINKWASDPRIKDAIDSLKAGKNPFEEKAAPTQQPGQPAVQPATPAAQPKIRVAKSPDLATAPPGALFEKQSTPGGAEPGAQLGLATAVPAELLTQDQSAFGKRGQPEQPKVQVPTVPQPGQPEKQKEQPPVKSVPAPDQPPVNPVPAPQPDLAGQAGDRAPKTPPAGGTVNEPPNLRGKSETDYNKFQGESRQPAEDRIQAALDAVGASETLTDQQKEAVSSLLNNPRTPHDIVYNAAKNESGSMERAPRREDIEAARNDPDLRAAASKLASIPLDARAIKNGDVQLQLWSGDKVLSNLDTLLSDPKAHRFVPWELKNGKLTEKGQADFAQDLQNYGANQDNGYRGDGQKLNRPANPQGFIPDENPNYTPVQLSKGKADFLNLLMGEDPPETARFNQGTVPIQVRARELAEINAKVGAEIKPVKKYKAPFEGHTIRDYNPLRVEMRKAGVDTTRLTEAHEWVNAKEIKSAKPRPDIKLHPTATDVTAAGFMPSKGEARGKEDGEPARLTKEQLMQFMPAKDVDLKDYIGKPVFVLTTDRMGVGRMKVGPKEARQKLEIPVQGGRGFMNIYKGGGWAFADEGAAKRFLSRVRQVAGDDDSAIAALTVLGPENHMNSPAGLAAYAQALRAAVEGGSITKKLADAHIKEIFSRLGETKSKLVTPENRELFQSIKSLAQFSRAVRDKAFNFEAAKHLMERANQRTLPIHWKDAEQMGIDVPSIARDIRDPGLHDLPTGSVVGLVEIPKNQTPKQSDFHFSYPWTVDGKAIGFLSGEHHVSNLTSDERIFQAPGRVGAQPLMTVMPKLDKMEQLEMQFMPSKGASEKEVSLADALRQKVRRAQIVSANDAVKALGSYPKYLNGVVNFLANRREALKNGEITPRDLAKAYAITVASQGSDAVNLSTLQKQFPDFKPDPSFLTGNKIRPEEAAAWWLGTPEGQKALNNVEAGKFDAADWEGLVKLRKAYGDDRLSYSGMFLKPGESFERPIYKTDESSRAVIKDEQGNPIPTGKVRRISMAEKGEVSMANLEETLKEINEAKGDRDKLIDAVQKLRGIGPAKAPFISHMLGFGGDITLDAVEINYWLTGKGNVKAAPEPKQAFVDAVKHDEGSQAILKNRIVKRLMEVREKSPEAAAIPEDAYLHVMHHWLWDKAKGTETTHEGVYKAAQEFMPSKGEEDEQHYSVTQRRHPGSGQFMPSKFWMDKAGRVKSTDDHAKEFAKPGEKIDNDNREIYASRGLAAGSLRAQVVDDTLWLEGQEEKFSHLPKAQRKATMDMAMNEGLAVNYNFRFIDPDMEFMPAEKKAEEEHHSVFQPRHPVTGQFTADDFKPIKRNGTLVIPVVRKDRNQHLTIIE